MVILIDGFGTINKGAELMGFAVLKEISRCYPDAEVIINNDEADISSLRKYYSLKIRHRQGRNRCLSLTRWRVMSVLERLSPSLSRRFTRYTPKDVVDVLLDIGGFQFGDQWNHTKSNIHDWEHYLKSLKKSGTKIIFLPQAFGPFEKESSKEMLNVISKYADMLMARDQISYAYLTNAGINNAKVLLFPDFTALASGVETVQSRECKGKVCFVPNIQMINQGVIGMDKYIEVFAMMINTVFEFGKSAFLLNHGYFDDLSLCQRIKERCGKDIHIYTGYDALETKGIIAASLMVVSSRFHGVANSLSSNVPCLATSWSHKYQMLFNDFGISDGVIDINDQETSVSKLKELLDQEKNNSVRISLMKKNEEVKKLNSTMWKVIHSSILGDI